MQNRQIGVGRRHFYGVEIQENPDVAACPELDGRPGTVHRGETREKSPENGHRSSRSAVSALGRPYPREPSGGVWGGIRAVWQVLEQRPVAWVIEKLIQMLDHELLDVGVLIGELEHHSADEDLAAGVCFPFAG